MFDDITPANQHISQGGQPVTPPPAPRAIVPKKNPAKVAALIIIILLGVMILGYGGYYAYQNFIVEAPVKEKIEVVPTKNVPDPAAAVETPTATLPVVVTSDADNDGLTDDEEKALGTNINEVDTDNDGLTDFDEVKIYFTDPLDSDSDGDSYLDGDEVSNGYNPNGEGRLLNFELEKDKTSSIK